MKLLQGIVPTTVKSVVATAITFTAYEAAKDYFIASRDSAEDVTSKGA